MRISHCPRGSRVYCPAASPAPQQCSNSDSQACIPLAEALWEALTFQWALNISYYLSAWRSDLSTPFTEDFCRFFCRTLTRFAFRQLHNFSHWLRGACSPNLGGKLRVCPWPEFLWEEYPFRLWHSVLQESCLRWCQPKCSLKFDGTNRLD